MNERQDEPLEALQAAYDAVIPSTRRTLAREDELLDLGVASVAALEMAGILEDRFEIRFPEYELGQLRTVGQFAELVERLRGQTASTQPDESK
jgi:acyl carrier protein